MVKVQKQDFSRFLACARPSAEIRVVEVQKQDFLRFLACARDPLRRFAWSRFKNCKLFTIFSMRAQPSAEIRVVEVQKLGTFNDFCGARATLCGDRARRSALAVALCEFVLFSANLCVGAGLTSGDVDCSLLAWLLGNMFISVEATLCRCVEGHEVVVGKVVLWRF